MIVNPIAGMGGRVGLKGTDGRALGEAVRRGATPVAPVRAREALRALKGVDVEVLAYSADMGEEEARACGLRVRVVGSAGRPSRAEDTVRAARAMVGEGVELIVFVGGDGTARDLCGVGAKVPVIGIPSGVKVHSAVFALTPHAGGQLAALALREPLPTREAEVMDVDEEAYRRGELRAKLFGYLPIPYEGGFVQGGKVGSVAAEDELSAQKAIAKQVVEEMEGGTAYVLGPGTTVKAVADELGLPKALLGVDVIAGGKLLAGDADEAKILGAISGRKVKVVVTPIGGQGFIFGRGNLQISPRVLRSVGREDIIVVATRNKLLNLPTRRLLVDTGDPVLDEQLRGYIKVITDYREAMLFKVE